MLICTYQLMSVNYSSQIPISAGIVVQIRMSRCVIPFQPNSLEQQLDRARVLMQITTVRYAASWLGRPTFAAKYIVIDAFRKLPPKNLGLTSHEIYEKALQYNAPAELGPLPKWAKAPHDGHAVRSMRCVLRITSYRCDSIECLLSVI